MRLQVLQKCLSKWKYCLQVSAKMTYSSQFRSMSRMVDRVGYMQKLKDNEGACQSAIKEGYFAIFCNLKPLLTREGILWKSYPDVVRSIALSYNCDPLKDAVFLTVDGPGGPPKFAVNIPSPKGFEPKEFETKVGEDLGGRASSLRKAMFILPEDSVAVLSLAYSMLQWHSKTQFCSCCGKTTVKDVAGYKRSCLSCSEIFYPTTQPVAITLVTNGNRCVLARQPRFPPQMYSALAGYSEPGESLARTVQREVAEEVGLEVDRIHFHDSQHWSLPTSSLMLGCYAELMDGSSDEIKIDKAELEEARWVSREELQALLEDEEATTRVLGLVGGPNIYIPPVQAIGNHLITSWALQK